MTLESRDFARLDRLSRSDVERTLSGLRGYLKTKDWVSGSNSYRATPSITLQAQADAGKPINSRDLAQYIAASSVHHCADGWSYLGKSIISVLRGDANRALHLAYYAELRAAMSLLATEGVGVFNRRHAVIDKPNSAVLLNGKIGTHSFVWECLEHWAGRKNSGWLFAQIIRPFAKTLDDWLQPIGGVATISPLAKDMFLQWGMDLKTFPKDRDARNDSSYKAEGIGGTWLLEGHSSLEFIRDLWKTLEPMPSSAFQNIDQHLLRVALETYFRSTQNQEPTPDNIKFSALISRIVANQNVNSKIAYEYSQFLRKKSIKSELVILKHSKDIPSATELGYAGTLSRAVLLLRAASGASADLLKSNNLNYNDIDFWCQELGNSRGLWDGKLHPLFPIDLWKDIQDVLEDVEIFQKSVQNKDQTFTKIGTDLRKSVIGLGSCERVAIWSMLD